MTATPEPANGPPVHHGLEFAGLFLLTVVTGMVDATSFLGLGYVFTANMTGNVLFLGFSVTTSPAAHLAHLSLGLTAVALAGFVAGALGSAAVVGTHRSTPHLGRGFAAEWTVLSAAVVVTGLCDPAGRGGRYAAVALLAVAMGIQNAAVRRMGLPDVNTTVLTTALGGLVADAVTVGGRAPRLGRRAATVGFLFAGAAAGAGLEQVAVVAAAVVALVLLSAGASALSWSGALRAAT